MANADLLGALDKVGRFGCLENLILYGRLRCTIAKPKMLSNLSIATGCSLAIVDVYAIKCLKDDYFRTDTDFGSNSVYYTKGSMIVCVSNKELIGYDVKLGGSSWNYGVKVKRQLGHKGKYDGITALAFRKEGSVFCVVPNVVKELTDKLDPHLRGTPLEDFFVKLYHQEPIPYPVSLDCLEEYEGVEDYIETTDNFEGKRFVDDGERVDISKIDLGLTYHLKGKDGSAFLEPLQEESDRMSDLRSEYAKNLTSELLRGRYNTSEDVDDVAYRVRRAFVSNIASKYGLNIGNSKVKGKVYVEALIEDFMRPIRDTGLEDPVNATVLKNTLEVLKSRVQADYTVLYEHELYDLPSNCTDRVECLSKDIAFAVSVIGVMTGIGTQALRSNFIVCSRRWDMLLSDWFFALMYYPYALGVLGSRISVSDLDRIYFSISKYFTEKGTFSKECGLLRDDLIFLNTMEEVSAKDTVINKSELKHMDGAYPALGKRMLLDNGFPANINLVEGLSALCGKSVRMSEKVVNFLLSTKWYSEERCEDLESKGIINSIDDSYVVLEKDLEKELYIFKRLISLGNEPTGITESAVENSIKSFENKIGFNLEELQKEGVKLVMRRAGVLSGCAGSGKTTTSDCMSMCLTTYMPKSYTMVYCTPTGKACRRLAEVVKGEVRTIHSQFKVGLYGESLLERVSSKGKESSKSIYLLDEMAMCNTLLLYEVVRNLGDNDLIYFLGDIKQLVSIGKGNPFALLMQILPCVELGVSKRAAEGSEINYNTMLINNMSDMDTRELVYDEESFFCRECNDNQIYLEASKAWAGFMDGSMNGKKYKEEDIQIITGYAKNTVSFSTTNVNPHIQKLLRKKDKLLFKYGDKEYYRNDRVIHINANCYGVQRYIEDEPGVYTPVVTLGVVNGEMGTLVDVVCSTTVIINTVDDYKASSLYVDMDEERLDNLIDIRESRSDMIRDDLLVRNEKAYLVKVRVYDVDLQRYVYIFYRATAHEQGDTLCLVGGDLVNLELAYALTTHKMQGSQSKVCILLFGSTCNPSFINRNMINTMVTRSQEVVCMVGTIKGEDSPVTRGRQTKSEMKTKDILSLLVNETI